MPIYEYRCKGCGKKSSFLVMNIHEPFQPTCRCGSTEMQRLMSRFSAVLSEDTRLERLTDPSRLGGLDENDPKSMARWMKKMGSELGEDMGEDFDQIMEEAMEEEAKGTAGEGGGGGDEDEVL